MLKNKEIQSRKSRMTCTRRRITRGSTGSAPVARWALRRWSVVVGPLGVAPCAVVGGHVARCAVVSVRFARWIGDFHAVGCVQVARCVQDVISQSCTLCDDVVVRKLGFSGVAQPLRGARWVVMSDRSRCVAAPLDYISECTHIKKHRKKCFCSEYTTSRLK